MSSLHPSMSSGASLDRRDDHRRSIAKNLGDAAHDLGRIVTNPDDRVGADRARMLDHELESLRSCLLAETAEQRDIAAEECLQRSADRAEDVSRPNGDPA